MSKYEIPDFSYTPGSGSGSEGGQIPNYADMPVSGSGYVPIPQVPDFSYSSSKSPTSGAATAENLPVKAARSPTDLTIPTQEDPVHKDLEIETGSVTTTLRWDPDMGYVSIGEKQGSGSLQLYDQAKFETVNAGQLKNSGGGAIPKPTSGKPEFYVPPDGDNSLIYRWDPESKKDVIVGCRADGQRSYFQSRATMDDVNAKAAAGGLLAPTRPLSDPSSTIPAGNKFNKDSSGKAIISQYDAASNGPANADGTKKEYIWRWDAKADRYCAVAETVEGSPGKYNWYSDEQYQAKNSGPDALQKADPAPLYAPDAGRQTVDTDGKTVKFITDDKKDSTGDGKMYSGDPIYVTDRDTGKKVMIGIQVTIDGKKVQYNFDESHMRDYNEQVTRADGTSYWEVKDTSKWPANSTSDGDATYTPSAEPTPTPMVGDGN